MKRTRHLTKLQKNTMALLLGLNVVLAIIVAAFLALVTPIDLAVRWIRKRLTSPTLSHQHL